MYYVPDPPLNQLSELLARCERMSPEYLLGALSHIVRFYFRTLEIVRDGLERQRPRIMADYAARLRDEEEDKAQWTKRLMVRDIVQLE